jgi:mannose-6-phosphate isomerase
MPMQVPLMRLQCGVNSYAWGKKGHDSAAAKFAAATPAEGFEIQHEEPYAEVCCPAQLNCLPEMTLISNNYSSGWALIRPIHPKT